MYHTKSKLVKSRADVERIVKVIPPSSFTFKMAFWNGTAFILKPKIRKQKEKN